MDKDKEYSAKRQHSPITFVCVVKGERLEATLSHAEKCPSGYRFHLSFSDGHKGVFVSIPNSRDWREEGVEQSAYAAAVSVDLYSLCMFDLNNPPFAIAATNEGSPFNVWVNPENGGYGVHYGGVFRFHLQQKKGTWSVIPGENYDRDTNRKIREAVTYRLLTAL